MHRRTFLILLATMPGCTSSNRTDEKERRAGGGNEGTSTTTIQSGDRTSTETTVNKSSSADCSTVETEFTPPELSKPSTLNTENVKDPVIRVERAYEKTVAIDSETLDLPDGAVLAQFNMYHHNTESIPSEEGFRVTVGGMARFKRGDLHGDRRVEVAAYRVTNRRIRRLSGIGDLVGTLVCW